MDTHTQITNRNEDAMSDTDHQQAETGLDKGFAQVPNHLFGRLTAFEIAVYAALARRTGSEGTCFPSHATIAAEAGCSVAQTRRALDSLVEQGIVDKTHRRNDRGGQTSNLYLVRVHKPSPDPVIHESTPLLSQSTPPALSDQAPCSGGATNKNQRNQNQKKDNPPASQSPHGGDEDPEAEIEWLKAGIADLERQMEEAQSHDEWLPCAIQRDNLSDELASASLLQQINAEPPVDDENVKVSEEVAA